MSQAKNMIVFRFHRLPNSSSKSQLQDSLDLQPFQQEHWGCLLSDLSICTQQLTALLCAHKDPRSLTQIYACKSIHRNRTLGGGGLPHHHSLSQAGTTKTQHTLACFSSINNAFSLTQATVLRLLSSLLPYVVAEIPANPLTFSPVPRLRCMATCHMSGNPTSAHSTCTQHKALVLPHLTEQKQRWINSVYKIFL